MKYSEVAARWWVEQILETIPAEAFWPQVDVPKMLAISQILDNIKNGQKEFFIKSLAKKIEEYVRKNGKLHITYYRGIIGPGEFVTGVEHALNMEVSKEKVEVWPGDGTSQILYPEDTQ